MSLSDLFNISRTVRRDKALQQDLLPTPSSSTPARLCNICYARPAAYNCPRCNIPYCSLACFRRKEHQECSTVFSSSAISTVTGSNVAEESERRNVVDILGRLERGEKEVRESQEHDEEDSSEDDDHDTEASVRAAVTAEDIESASIEGLLAMLTSKQRTKFLSAAKDPQQAAALMRRLDQKAGRRARMERSASQQGVLIASQSDSLPRQQSSAMNWQSQPWFDQSDASPPFFRQPSQQSSSFMISLDKILSSGSTSSQSQPAPVDLEYNLCTVLMAYAHTLRNMDVESLADLSVCGWSESEALEAKAVPMTPVFEHPNTAYGDDEEPPPLEPDSPTEPAVTTSPPSSATQPTTALSHNHLGLDKVNLAEDVFDHLTRLVPFVFHRPQTSNASRRTSGESDYSKTLLTTLEDASMWLLSRLSFESSMDLLNLQLLEDLAKLLDREQLVPTFSSDQQVEPKFLLASKLTSLSPQQAFAAAQTPLVLNAIADLYFFLEDLSKAALIGSKATKLTQRKLCYYFSNTMLGDGTLLAEVQASIQSLRVRIDAAEQADKLAAAVNLLDHDRLTPMQP